MLFLVSVTVASLWLPASSFVPIGRQQSFRLVSSATSAVSYDYSPDSKTHRIEFELHPSISDISAESWDACLDESSSPFLEHAWLRCLEESKCASPETGWVPQHVSIAIDGQVRGYVPLYLKGHSMGEFIFDSAWAEAAHDNNINYYPKLLVGVPFTPATGQRILLHPDLNHYSRQQVADLRRTVGEFLKQVALSNNISSVHLNFVTDEEATDFSGTLSSPDDDDEGDASVVAKTVRNILEKLSYKDYSYLRRTSLQYHWTNSNVKNDGKPYTSFDDYLGCFKSKRRITIRRERTKVRDDEGIRVEAILGKDILKYEGLVERMFEIYVSTVDKLYWGRQYLSLEFFQLVCKSDFVKNLCFMVATRLKGEELRVDHVFAGTFNIVKDGVFYGRYWGCLAGNQVKNLHFETCYWSAIDYCIQNGLKRMEPGAGGGGTRYILAG
jgi:predicted N-acyltransferase